MDMEFGITVYRSIADFHPDATIYSKGMSINCQLKTPKVCLVPLKNGVIVNERIIFTTKAEERVNLRLNCRENLILETSPVFLQIRQVTSNEDVGDLAIVRFGTTDCDLRYPCKSWAVCEGLILSKFAMPFEIVFCIFCIKLISF